jgi:hypothetical protein
LEEYSLKHVSFYELKRLNFFLPFFLVLSLMVVNAQNTKRSLLVKKVEEKIILDGKLSEDIWLKANSAENFWQLFPTDSLKSINKTSVKILFNDTHLLIGIEALAIDKNFIVSSLKRDFSALTNDNVTILFDTFRDGQNAFLFGVSAFGVQREGLISERGSDINGFSLTWDIKWQSESVREKDKFTIEMAIPFSSIKYPEGSQKWGFQTYRFDLQTNERSIWTKVPQNQFPINIGYYGELLFEEPLPSSNTPLYLIPYTNVLVSKDFSETTSQKKILFGGDMKIPVGNGLNLDITLNPDFSNVEVDNIITNLTRFEISLPEKRQFFIDNRDLFESFGSRRDAIPFFSRRIGIAKDSTGISSRNDILGGIRLSGKLNQNWRIGILNIQNQEDIYKGIASNNNSMLAVQRKVFGQSQIGLFVVNRQTFKDYSFTKEENRYNRVVGMDYNLNSTNNKWIGKFFTHKSFQPNDTKGNLSSQANLIYNTRIWRFSSDWVYVDDDFTSDLGFIPRTGIFKSGTSASRNFYPNNKKINSYSFRLLNLMWFQKNLDYKKTDHFFSFEYELEFKKQSQLGIEFKKQFVYLSSPFDPSRSENGEPLPGQTGYDFGNWSISYQSPLANAFNFTSTFSYGTFFNGTRFSYQGTAQFRFQPKVILSLLWDYNKIILPNPYPTAKLLLISPKIQVTLNRNLFWSTLIQYSNQIDDFGINSRLQWRFAPLSDLYLVYNDSYDAEQFSPVFRSINLKLTYWINL